MRAIVLAALVTFAAACGADVPAEHCTPGEQTACGCPDGTQSVKQCTSNGAWGACACSGQ